VLPLAPHWLAEVRYGMNATWQEDAMIVARWQIDARFGYKPRVIELMNQWMDEIGAQVGWERGDNVTLLTGSVGVPESRIEVEHRLKDIAELNTAFEKLATLDAHKDWSKELEPYVVSGSTKWVILRVLD